MNCKDGGKCGLGGFCEDCPMATDRPKENMTTIKALAERLMGSFDSSKNHIEFIKKESLGLAFDPKCWDEDEELKARELLELIPLLLKDSERLAEALGKAEPHIILFAEAEHILDGLRERIPSPMDSLVNEISEALAEHEKVLEKL